jgi:hypothetical protein
MIVNAGTSIKKMQIAGIRKEKVNIIVDVMQQNL